MPSGEEHLKEIFTRSIACKIILDYQYENISDSHNVNEQIYLKKSKIRVQNF